MEKRRPLRDLLYIDFNQDYQCFAVGASNGFRVYNCEPFKETFRREFAPGGVAIVEMLFRCNIMALVGGGTAPKYPPNKVMIWDDHQGRCIGELSFRSQVRAVRLRRDRIVVALEHKVLVYNFADLRLLHTIETLSNPSGLLALSPSADQTVLACPGLHVGQVRVELYDTRRTKFIAAHNSDVRCLTLSSNGKLLVTASEKGTLIRVFSTGDGSKLQEVRRGSDPARIYSLAFSRGEWPDWLAVTSDKGTLHVFSLRRGMGQGEAARGGGGGSSGGASSSNGSNAAATGADDASPTRANPTSALSFVSSYLPVGGAYFASERSFAQFRFPEACPCLVGFGSTPGTLLLVSYSGCFHRVAFDGERGGQCEQLAFSQFMEDLEG
ncbi:hypothetical protein N2152v2_007253 [Parachlorella kessleri]